MYSALRVAMMEIGTGAEEKTERKSSPSISDISRMPCSRETVSVVFMNRMESMTAFKAAA